MFCEYCGGSITKDMRVCPVCGKPTEGAIRMEVFREGKGLEVNVGTEKEAADKLKRDPIVPARRETPSAAKPVQAAGPDHSRELEELRRTNVNLRAELETSRQQLFEAEKAADAAVKKSRLLAGIGMLALFVIALAILLILKSGSDGKISDLNAELEQKAQENAGLEKQIGKLEQRLAELEPTLTPAVPTETPTPTPTETPEPTPTDTPSPTPTDMPTPTPTEAPVPTDTPIPTPTMTPLPTPETEPTVIPGGDEMPVVTSFAGEEGSAEPDTGAADSHKERTYTGSDPVRLLEYPPKGI